MTLPTAKTLPPARYLAWPIVENPWMKQTDGKELTAIDGRSLRTYDFSAWRVVDRPIVEDR
jgi:hypothetical protein